MTEPENRLQPYAPPVAETYPDLQREELSRPHSALGLTSFVLAGVAGGVIVGLIVLAGILSETAPDLLEQESFVVALGLAVFACLGLNLLGLVLGVVGLLQSHRSPTFAIAGLVLNTVVLLGIFSLIVVGTVAG